MQSTGRVQYERNRRLEQHAFENEAEELRAGEQNMLKQRLLVSVRGPNEAVEAAKGGANRLTQNHHRMLV